MTTLLNSSIIVPTPYAGGVKLMEYWVSGVPDTQYREIRTLEEARGGSKKFCCLSRLRQVGNETAQPGNPHVRENVHYAVAPRYEHRQAESNTDRGDPVNLATTRWLGEISRPPPFSWMVESSWGRRYGDVATGPSPEFLPNADGEMKVGEDEEGTPGCTSTPVQPSTQIPCTLTHGSGAGVPYSTEGNASAATGGGGCCGQT